MTSTEAIVAELVADMERRHEHVSKLLAEALAELGDMANTMAFQRGYSAATRARVRELEHTARSMSEDAGELRRTLLRTPAITQHVNSTLAAHVAEARADIAGYLEGAC